MGIDANETKDEQRGVWGGREGFAAFFKHRLSNLAGALQRGVSRESQSWSCSGFRVARWRGKWLATAKFSRSDDVFHEHGGRVAFGAGDSPFDALHNLNASIGRKELKPDKFGQSPAEPTPDDMASEYVVSALNGGSTRKKKR